MWVTSSTNQVLKPNAIALGNFDGIHRGHQQVIQPILRYVNHPLDLAPSVHKQQNKTAEHKACVPTVVSFNPHPQEFFTGVTSKLLTPLPEKIQELERLGIKQLVLLPFDKILAQFSPQEFVAKILVEQLQVSFISVGEDFRFGHRRTGTAKDLKAIASQFGVEVSIASLETTPKNNHEKQIRISSSHLRTALQKGDIPLANRLLGRAYSLTGKVVQGARLGSKIGFPTANLQIPPNKFLPRRGVYLVRVAPTLRGVMNVGCRPTVDGKTTTVEVHLLDWSGNLYGKTITASLYRFMRSEQKFSSLEALKATIAEDCQLARTLFQSNFTNNSTY
ncbi:MAG: bifunctional riboflavin kinase/FAD synthetase [Prochloron sp. SP5CPC1]|nr:bifunctional riboflavin kinase/FAD synthetase [Candidatus Paraprochloron terpiosi SP5CPC1]